MAVLLVILWLVVFFNIIYFASMFAEDDMPDWLFAVALFWPVMVPLAAIVSIFLTILLGFTMLVDKVWDSAK